MNKQAKLLIPGRIDGDELLLAAIASVQKKEEGRTPETTSDAGNAVLEALLAEAAENARNRNSPTNGLEGAHSYNNYGRNFENYARNFENYARNFENYARNFENYARNFSNYARSDSSDDATPSTLAKGVLPNGGAAPADASELLTKMNNYDFEKQEVDFK